MTRLPTSQQRIFKIEDEFKESLASYLQRLNPDDVDADEHEDVIDLVAVKIMNVDTTKEELKAAMKDLYPDSAGKIAAFTWEELARLGGPSQSLEPEPAASEPEKVEPTATTSPVEEPITENLPPHSPKSDTKECRSSVSPAPRSETPCSGNEQEISQPIKLSPPTTAQVEPIVTPPLTYPPLKGVDEVGITSQGVVRPVPSKVPTSVQDHHHHHHHHQHQHHHHHHHNHHHHHHHHNHHHHHHHHNQHHHHHHHSHGMTAVVCLRRHPDEATGFKMEERADGVYLTNVEDNTPAIRCGMQHHVGRRIVQINNIFVKRISECMAFSRSPVLTFHFDMKHPPLQLAQQRKPLSHHHFHHHQQHHHHHHHHHNLQRAQQLLQQPAQNVPISRLPQRPEPQMHHHHHHHQQQHQHHQHQHQNPVLPPQQEQQQPQRPIAISTPQQVDPQQRKETFKNIIQQMAENANSTNSIPPSGSQPPVKRDSAVSPTTARVNIERQLNNEIESKKEELIRIQEKREKKEKKKKKSRRNEERSDKKRKKDEKHDKRTDKKEEELLRLLLLKEKQQLDEKKEEDKKKKSKAMMDALNQQQKQRPAPIQGNEVPLGLQIGINRLLEQQKQQQQQQQQQQPPQQPIQPSLQSLLTTIRGQQAQQQQQQQPLLPDPNLLAQLASLRR